MVQNICGRETAEKNRNKAGVTISDGCDGILCISANGENTVTIDATVTRDEKDWLDSGEIWNMCRRGYKAGRRAEQSAWNIWRCTTNISSAVCRSKPPAGRKTRLRVAFLMGLPVKNAFALLLTKVTKEGLCPDAARTTNVRADTDKDCLRLRLSARLWLEDDSLEADIHVKHCITICKTKQAEIFCRKQERELNTEVVLQFVRQKRILFYSMSNNRKMKNLLLRVLVA